MATAGSCFKQAAASSNAVLQSAGSRNPHHCSCAGSAEHTTAWSQQRRGFLMLPSLLLGCVVAEAGLS
uniref:Uncharacterized protein n=1 Tax=Tetradesmus obliquus TaxID=3088 RepID=A0A383W014_TETOB